jgi:hypothetical protein
VNLKQLKYEEITEETARSLIATGQAGHWEVSKRGIQSQHPLQPPEWVCVFVDERWFKVPRAVFEVVSTVTCHDAVLAAHVMRDVSRLGKFASRFSMKIADPVLDALVKEDVERTALANAGQKGAIWPNA